MVALAGFDNLWKLAKHVSLTAQNSALTLQRASSKRALLLLNEFKRLHMVGVVNEGLLGDSGASLVGSELNLEAAMAAARKRYKRLPLCVVEEWIILDAIVTDDERAKVASAGCQPMFMFAHKVVDEEQRRFEPGHWVRSSMGTAFNDGFMFETRNSVYVLLGPGHRKSATIKEIFSLF